MRENDFIPGECEEREETKRRSKRRRQDEKILLRGSHVCERT